MLSLGDSPVTRRSLLRSLAVAATSLVPIVGTTACRKRQRQLLVGFSQLANSGIWRTAETASLRHAANARSDTYELVVTDAQDQTAKQISDVEDLIARRVYAIFLAPREYEGLEPALETARKARIPVFLIDREAAGEPGVDYVCFLGSDFIEQGRRAARRLAQHVGPGGHARIIELYGTAGSSVARDRSWGFRDALQDYPNLQIIGAQTADFARAAALRVMENIIQSRRRELTAVYAHNDEMALGAIQALRSAGMQPGRQVTVISIDGERAALLAIQRGELLASIESNPRFGPLAFATLDRFRAGQRLPPKIILQDRLFDASNAGQFIDDAY